MALHHLRSSTSLGRIGWVSETRQTNSPEIVRAPRFNVTYMLEWNMFDNRITNLLYEDATNVITITTGKSQTYTHALQKICISRKYISKILDSYEIRQKKNHSLTSVDYEQSKQWQETSTSPFLHYTTCGYLGMCTPEKSSIRDARKEISEPVDTILSRQDLNSGLKRLRFGIIENPADALVNWSAFVLRWKKNNQRAKYSSNISRELQQIDALLHTPISNLLEYVSEPWINRHTWQTRTRNISAVPASL